MKTASISPTAADDHGVLKRAKFLALDSSHLGNLARELVSKDASVRQDAVTLENAIKAHDYILVLSMHHFQELLVHSNSDVVTQRMAFLQSLPLVAIVNSARDGGVAGSVFDIQAAEVRAAFQHPDARPLGIRGEVAAGIFRLVSGMEAVRSVRDNLPTLQIEMIKMAERSREIVAITRSNFAGVSHRKVSEFLSGKLHAPLDIQRNLSNLDMALKADIHKHGDHRIPDPDGVSSAFMADIYQRSLALSDSENPGLQILAWFDIDISEISLETTIGDIGDWAVFRTKLKRLNQSLGLPWNELKMRVKEERLPSGIISSALAQFRPQTAEWKGSDLTDVHLACLSLYADLTFVDKRTYEGLLKARKKLKELPRILRRVEKAKNTRVVLEHLA